VNRTTFINCRRNAVLQTVTQLATPNPNVYLTASSDEVFSLAGIGTTYNLVATKKDGTGYRTAITTGTGGTGLAFDGTDLWYTLYGIDNLYKKSITNTPLLAISNYSTGQVQYHNSHIYNIFYTSFKKYDLTGAITSSYTAPAYPDPDYQQFNDTNVAASFCFENSNIWVCSTFDPANRIAKFTESGANITSVANYTVNGTKKITYDGSWIWVSNNTSTLYRINPSSGVITSYVIPELTAASAIINWVKYLSSLNITVITCSDDKIRYIDTTVTPPVVTTTLSTGISPQEAIDSGGKIYVANNGSNYITVIS